MTNRRMAKAGLMHRAARVDTAPGGDAEGGPLDAEDRVTTTDDPRVTTDGQQRRTTG